MIAKSLHVIFVVTRYLARIAGSPAINVNVDGKDNLLGDAAQQHFPVHPKQGRGSVPAAAAWASQPALPRELCKPRGDPGQRLLHAQVDTQPTQNNGQQNSSGTGACASNPALTPKRASYPADARRFDRSSLPRLTRSIFTFSPAPPAAAPGRAARHPGAPAPTTPQPFQPVSLSV